MKTHVCISLDAEVYQKHRTAGHNISHLCNVFLAEYSKGMVEVDRMQITKDAGAKIAALESVVQQGNSEKELKKLALRAAQCRTTNTATTNKILHKICEKYGLSWAEAVKLMERG